jgi:glucuronoarabinoxylan endo-1,4-beta-xylanase
MLRRFWKPGAVALMAVLAILILRLFTSTSVAINWRDAHQSIDGFGAASYDSFLTSADADFFFGRGPSQLGLSLLRVIMITDPPNCSCIDPGVVDCAPVPAGHGSLLTNDLQAARMAKERGATVWATSMSVPASMKSSGSFCKGGTYAGGAANDKALAVAQTSFLSTMTNKYGVPIAAFSFQNEPDILPANYPGTRWTAQQLHDYVPVLAGMISDAGLSTRIAMPEMSPWNSFALAAPSLSDPRTAVHIGILAAHNYDQLAPAAPPSIPGRTDQRIWETEVSNQNAFDPSMKDALVWAARIHAFLTRAHVNAWHYWWINAVGGGLKNNEALTNGSNVPAKRAYVLGQWARFVRPGWVEIGVNNSGQLLVSAFRDASEENLAVVVVNRGLPSLVTMRLSASPAFVSVTPYITSSASSLASQSAIPVNSGVWKYQLPAFSVTTFVGTRDRSVRN